jgi:hypothetical protein
MSRLDLVVLLRPPGRHDHEPARGAWLSCLFVATAVVACLAVPAPAHAQFLGHNTLGDYGLMSGTQAPPGFYLSGLYFRYDGDRLRTASGTSITPEDIDPALRPDLGVNAIGVGVTYITNAKLLGANVGFVFFPSWTDNMLEVPILGLSSKTPLGFTDLYVQPLNLGWNRERADFTAGIGIFAPTGRFETGGDENTGLGMWSFELFGGTTVYFDEAKKWHFATVGFYETHTKKRGTNLKVGDILTLEGGFGRSFLDGAAAVGLTYYAQWKLTEDSIGDIELPIAFDIHKHRGFGFGPEITLPIIARNKLIAIVNARYFWETGVRSSVEGQTFLLYATFPIPSWPVQ